MDSNENTNNSLDVIQSSTCENNVDSENINSNDIEDEIMMDIIPPPIQTNNLINTSNSQSPVTPFPSFQNTYNMNYYMHNSSSHSSSSSSASAGFNQYNHFHNIYNQMNSIVRAISPVLFTNTFPHFNNTNSSSNMRQGSPVCEDPTRMLHSPINLLSELSRLSPTSLLFVGEDPIGLQLE